MRRLVDNLIKKINYNTGILERRIYSGDITGTRHLPSPSITYVREKEIRSTGYAMYRYREYETERVNEPIGIPSQTRYERWYEFQNYYKGVDLGTTLVVTFSTTVFPDGNRREGGSICMRLKRREERSHIDLLVVTIVGIMNGFEKDNILSVVIGMSSAIRKWRLEIPSSSVLEWKDVSMESFRDCTIVEPRQGRTVLYVFSPSGTFLLDSGLITPIDVKISSSLGVLVGRYDGTTFYPYDTLIREGVSVSGYTYPERLDMISSFDLTPPPSISRPQTPDDFFAFAIGKKELLFYSPKNTYSWTSTLTTRILIGEGGVPLGLESDNLVPVKASVKDSLRDVGNMVNVLEGKVVSVDMFNPAPMKKGRIDQILSSDSITSDSLTGRNCVLYYKYIERVLSLLYSFYSTRGVKSVLDLSSGLDHMYWTASNLTTYALSDSSDRRVFVARSGGIPDENSVIGEGWDVEFVTNDSIGEDITSVEATDIFRTSPSLDDLDTYVSLSTKYVSFISTNREHRDRSVIMSNWGWEVETELRLDQEELLPVDESCREDLTLYIWRQKERRPESIRLIYNPVAVGVSSSIESPYGALSRVGTLGSTTSGRDDSFIHALLTAHSPEYRRMDKVGKTIYALRNRNNLRINVPIYLIPKDSWKMYLITRDGTYVYDIDVPRPKGIVLFVNKGHWEPLARRGIDNSLNYIW